MWAGRAEISTDEVFETLHSGLTVELISTSRDDLKTCALDDAIADVIKENTEAYDFLPVTVQSVSGAKSIVGLFNAAKYSHAATLDGRVNERLDPLSEALLIGADARILDFIKDADDKPCRLVVSDSGIVGLVTLSDLQKLPVRAVLFAVITGFEITMMELIRKKFQSDKDWLSCLTAGRQTKIASLIEESRSKDGFVDALLFTQFCDKADIIRSSFEVPEEGSRALERKLKEIQKLRDNVAHANEYAASVGDAKNACLTVRHILDLRNKLVDPRILSTHK